jgi:branched-chain amino acid transport system permease protein
VVFGSAPVSISTPLSSSPWIVGPLYGEDILLFINQGQTIAASIAVAVVVGFALLMSRSRLGRSLRAAADNPRAAIYMGIDVDRAYRLAFGFGVGITAIGGGLLASSYPFQPYVGIEYVIVMYAGVVLGGLGSLRGAFFGGLTIGLVQQLSALFLPNQLQNTAIFVVFLLIILLKPDGLFGRAARRA